MSDLDRARELVRTTLFGLDDPLRPQDAAAVTADLAYLTPALATLIERIGRNLDAAERLPGLYTTETGDARGQLRKARAHLETARHTADTLARQLDEAHQTLSTIGHGEASDTPLTAVIDPGHEDRPTPGH